MSCDIRSVKDLPGFINYLKSELNWGIDVEDFDEVDDYTFEWTAEDLDIQEDVFAKIVSLKQLRPSSDEDKWGIFCVEFDSPRFEVSVLRKILSGLIPNQRQTSDRAVWQQRDLLFICFWGKGNNNTIGVAHFEDKEQGLPQIKMIYCSPAVEENNIIKVFENRLAKLKWPEDPSDTEKWRDEWSAAFTVGYKETIRTSAVLTVKLAEAAQNIKDRVLEVLKIESERGYVHSLYNKFKELLIHDMSEKQFADMYAQTVVYGLFSARCMDKTQDDFSSEEAIECIPNTNPFLKNLMKECFAVQSSSKISFDELEIGNVVDLLLHTRTDTIVEDFGKKTGNEDPIIHFYESFLEVYDKEQKVQRGVFYTPQPVVKFIISAVDDILKSEFDIKDGLASTETKKIKYMRKSKKLSDGKFGKVYKTVEDTKEVPKVQILDPSTGTGTFLRQAILQIYENFRKKYVGESESKIKDLWNKYVPEHLLPRLSGYELMMAPYAVAHMKLAMVLKETGYDFSSVSRLNVFLTNTLEPVSSDNKQMSLWTDPLAMESLDANESKKPKGINIVIGNPPYSGESANKGEWITNLLEVYKKEPGGNERLREQNSKWINDDYVKFIRYAQMVIDNDDSGVLAFINPHGFIDNPTFRGMRWALLKSFSKIYILDLHGNYKKKEKCPDGNKDENVFDIQQGVCIFICIKERNNKECSTVYHKDLYGNRNDKYSYLNSTRIYDINWECITPDTEKFLFIGQNNELNLKWKSYFSIAEAFPVNGVGICSKRDSIAYQKTKESMINVLNDFVNLPEEQIKEKYQVKTESRDQKVSYAKENVISYGIKDKYIHCCLYRPFDYKWTYYTDKVRGFLAYPVYKVLANMLMNNIGLIVSRQGQASNISDWNVVFASKSIVDLNVFRRGGGCLFPLYIYEELYGEVTKRVNINNIIIEAFSNALNIPFKSIRNDNQVDCFSPEDILAYIYAILHSNNYRKSFKNFLNLEFPRIPYPKDIETFFELVKLGKLLLNIHCMTSNCTAKINCNFISGSNIVEKVTYSNNRVYINKTQYFDDVDSVVWMLQIGGYQVLEKWLKDRKNTILNAYDINQYNYIIYALKSTINIMDSIDEIVEF